MVTIYHGYENGFTTLGRQTHTADELLSLRPALFATGEGQGRFRNFQYRAMED